MNDIQLTKNQVQLVAPSINELTQIQQRAQQIQAVLADYAATLAAAQDLDGLYTLRWDEGGRVFLIPSE